MAVYVIAGYDITDPKGYEGYVPGVVPLLQKHGAEILVADYESQPVEGESRKVMWCCGSRQKRRPVTGITIRPMVQ